MTSQQEELHFINKPEIFFLYIWQKCFCENNKLDYIFNYSCREFHAM